MKKLITLCLLACSLALSASAQDIYNTMLADARNTADNTGNNLVVRRIAKFKCAALEYVKEKAFLTDQDVTVRFLDDQAYYMNEFLNSFFKDVLLNTEISKTEKKKRILLFVDASGSNPILNDPDKDVVAAYVVSDGQLTPFSLDTNWPKAYAAVQSVLKKEDQK